MLAACSFLVLGRTDVFTRTYDWLVVFQKQNLAVACDVCVCVIGQSLAGSLVNLSMLLSPQKFTIIIRTYLEMSLLNCTTVLQYVLVRII